MTFVQAKNLMHGDILYHKFEKNADGTPARWRVTGKVKFWKTRPNELKVPLARGLYQHAYLNHNNYKEFSLTEK